MEKVSTIGLDIAKNVFQVHGVDSAGVVVIRRTLRRSQVLAWFAKLPQCLVGIEACATAHYWGRELRRLGHEVRLIPPAYAKAYVRRNKSDPADAAAICEAVGRPAMRFVAIKTAPQQALAGIHRVRDLLIKQRTMLKNQLRGLMAEFGIVAAQGRRGLNELLAILSDIEDRRIPSPLREALIAVMETLRGIERKLEGIDRQIVAAGREDATCRHLVTAPATGRSCRAPWRRWRSTPAPSSEAPILPPRSVWCRARRAPAASCGWAQSANAATAICAGSWSMARHR
jgi:transposase